MEKEKEMKFKSKYEKWKMTKGQNGKIGGNEKKMEQMKKRRKWKKRKNEKCNKKGKKE